MYLKSSFLLIFLFLTRAASAQTSEETAWFEQLTPEWKRELQFSMERIIGNPSQYRPATAAEVAWITTWKGFFFSNFSPVGDLEPISRFRDLERLNINNLPVSNLAPLKGLNLYQVSLNFTKVENLDALSGMTNLEKLDLAGTNIKSLKPLYACTHLQALDVRGTPLTEKDLAELQRKLPDCAIWYKTEPKPLALPAAELAQNRAWWNGISAAWQQTFRNELSLIHPEPTDAALHEIGQLKRLRLVKIELPTKEILDFTDLKPIEKLQNLQELIVNGTGIKSLDPLKNTPKLTHLECRQTAILAVSALANCPNLLYLDALDTDIESIEPLTNAKKLTHLNIAGTKVNNLAAITGKNLEYLNINGTSISDLTPLTGMGDLYTLEASHCNISSIEPLRSDSLLQSLNIRNTKVSSIKGLNKMKYLQKLSISETPISDIGALGGLKYLLTLRMNKTKVASLQALANSKSLLELEFSETPIDDLQPLSYLKNLEKISFAPNKVKSLIPLFQLENLQKLVFCKQSFTNDEIREAKRALIQASVTAIECP